MHLRKQKLLWNKWEPLQLAYAAMSGPHVPENAVSASLSELFSLQGVVEFGVDLVTSKEVGCDCSTRRRSLYSLPFIPSLLPLLVVLGIEPRT